MDIKIVHRKELERLRVVFEICYDKYRRDVLKMKKEEIYHAASEIAATEEMFIEVYVWIIMSRKPPAVNWPRTPMTDNEAEYLLSLENPLKTLATQFWFFIIGTGNAPGTGNAGSFIDKFRKDWELKPPNKGEDAHAETS